MKFIDQSIIMSRLGFYLQLPQDTIGEYQMYTVAVLVESDLTAKKRSKNFWSEPAVFTCMLG